MGIIKKLKQITECSCGYKASGKNLKEKRYDLERHIKESHPEKRMFEL